MGSENSKGEDREESQRNQNERELRQRLYTEDEIYRALENQKRMFEVKQLKMQTSSGIYPNLQTQNLNGINSPITSNAAHYSIIPSAPPEDVLISQRNTTVSIKTYQQTSPARTPTVSPSSTTPSAAPSHITSAGLSPAVLSSTGASHITSSSARPSLATLSSVGPSHITPSSAGPSHVNPPTAGPSHVKPPTAGPSHVTPPSAGPSRVKPSVARPTHATPSSAGPSHVKPPTAGPSHTISSSVGPSHITPSLAEPSHAIPSSARPYKRSQNRNQARRTRSMSRVNQNRKFDGLVKCVTCNGELSLHIYQCTKGHSSCEGCKFKMARCGNCTELITDMRNITLESTLADMIISTEEGIKCPNAKDGCCLQFEREEIQNHLKECPFNIISCPVLEFSGDCFWKGTIKQLAVHFNDAHPKHREADVNKEMIITVIQQDQKVMHLVNIGFYKFLVHIRLDTSLNNIYMVTQYLGTNFGASKWSYEWHVYNKREPRRKFEYIDICKSNATPVAEIVNNNDCAIINMDYAKTFLDSGKLTYKFYIKKQFDTNKNIETSN